MHSGHPMLYDAGIVLVPTPTAVNTATAYHHPHPHTHAIPTATPVGLPTATHYAPTAVTPAAPGGAPTSLQHTNPVAAAVSVNQHIITTSSTPAAHPQKRGSEDLLGHSVVTNGSGMSPVETGMDMVNDAKKVKLDSPKASRVVHFRGVPADATENEIVQLGLPFGRMTNLVLARKKNQALLEMGDINNSTTMVNYYAEHPPHIRGQVVYAQYSNHEELKTESSNVPAGAQAALQAASQMVGAADETRTVLRVIVEQMMFPVTIEVLKQIFSRYGQVLRLVTFSKNNTFQALIEFAESISAQTAKVSLNGQNIYNSCCLLRIDFSKLTSLNVKYNNDKSRDYTNPNLPSGDNAVNPLEAGGVAAASAALGLPQLASPAPHTQPAMMSPFTTAMHAGLGGTGAMSSVGQFAPAGQLSCQPTSAALTASALANSAAAAGFSTLHSLAKQTNYGTLPYSLLTAAPQLAAMTATGFRIPGLHSLQTGPVLMVSNLNEEMVTPDALFTLFGVYGDVQRVKIMFNKKDNALVQFTDANQANTAMIYLDKVTLWGKTIKVTPSKHAMVQLPKEGQPDAGLTKDYVMSPLHRFKKPNSKNHNNIFPPSSTLHLSNIPANVTEETLSDAFAKHGTIVAFKFFQKDRKMALIQMQSCEEAIHSLIALHNLDLGNSHHLRVSFTKSSI